MCKKLEDRSSQRRFSAVLSKSLLLYRGTLLVHRSSSDEWPRCSEPNMPYLETTLTIPESSMESRSYCQILVTLRGISQYSVTYTK